MQTYHAVGQQISYCPIEQTPTRKGMYCDDSTGKFWIPFQIWLDIEKIEILPERVFDRIPGAASAKWVKREEWLQASGNPRWFPLEKLSDEGTIKQAFPELKTHLVK